MLVFQGWETSCDTISRWWLGHRAGFLVVGGDHEAPGSPADTALLYCSAGTGKAVSSWSCLETGKSNTASKNTASS